MAEYVVFYVDPDDEILSFIARMKETEAGFVVLVVPQRAVLFSSIITMRILKKEADRLRKDIFLVTQDEQGLEMARRVGFIVRKTLEEIPFIKEERRENAREENREHSFQQRSNFFTLQETPDRIIEKRRSFDAVPSSQGILRRGSIGGGTVGASRSVAQALFRTESSVNKRISPLSLEEKEEGQRSFEGDPSYEVGSSAWGSVNKLPDGKGYNDTSEKLPGVIGGDDKTLEEHSSTHSLSLAHEELKEKRGHFRRMWIFVVVFFVFLGLAGAFVRYAWTPEVRVMAYLKKEDISGDAHYKLSGEEEGGIQARFLEYSEEIKVSEPSTGIIPGRGRKASGSVVLYNDFSKEDQPLVATTRLQSPDGKIFRIIRSVVIPGIQEKEGKKEPGQVEVDVQADAIGAEYNVQATKFTIPGFSGGPKYEKIYAKSTSAMSGGGSTDEKTSLVVSDEDIVRVKKKVEASIREKIGEKIKTEFPSSSTMNDLIEVTFLDGKEVPSVGTVTESFDFQAKVLVRYFIFSEELLKEEAFRQVRGEEFGSKESPVVEGKVLHLEYGKITPDFEKKTVDMKMFISGHFFPAVPLESLKRDITGMSVNDLQGVLDTYKQIQRFEVEMSGFGTKTLPQDPEKIHIEVREE